MITKVVYIEPEHKDEFYHVADQIMMLFPCFISAQPVEMDWDEVTIQCREEDAAAIEKQIAPFV